MELEGYPDKVDTVSPWDFGPSQHKVDFVEVVPYYNQSVLLKFEEYLVQAVETVRYLVKVG